MDMAGNPWGTYDQDEPCIHCGAALVAPNEKSGLSRIYSAAAIRLDRPQTAFAKPHPNWNPRRLQQGRVGQLRRIATLVVR